MTHNSGTLGGTYLSAVCQPEDHLSGLVTNLGCCCCDGASPLVVEWGEKTLGHWNRTMLLGLQSFPFCWLLGSHLPLPHVSVMTFCFVRGIKAMARADLMWTQTPEPIPKDSSLFFFSSHFIWAVTVGSWLTKSELESACWVLMYLWLCFGNW